MLSESNLLSPNPNLTCSGTISWTKSVQEVYEKPVYIPEGYEFVRFGVPNADENTLIVPSQVVQYVGEALAKLLRQDGSPRVIVRRKAPTVAGYTLTIDNPSQQSKLTAKLQSLVNCGQVESQAFIIIPGMDGTMQVTIRPLFETTDNPPTEEK